MTNEPWKTRWARELNERDLRLMREKGPGYIHYVDPPPPHPWQRSVAWAVIVALLFGIGVAIGTLARMVLG